MHLFLAHPSISRDGKRIVYSAVLETQHVQMLGFDPEKEETTGLPVNITTGSRLYSSCDITPDGQMLVCYSRTQPEGDLWVMRSDGSGSKRITTGFRDRVPRWSPAGDWIAFFSDRSNIIRIWKIRPDASEIQQLADVQGGIANWSPDGKRMAFSSVGTAETYVIDPNLPWADQTPETLPHYQGSLRALITTSWSRDGDKLAFQSGFSDRGQNPNPGIAMYSFKHPQYQELTHYGEWPVWLPDSRRLLIVNNGKEYIVIDSQDKEKEGHKIYSVDRGSISPPRMTRDGREIYFSLRLTEADIWRIDLK